MFARSILASSALLISFTASAAPQWAMLEGDIGDHTFLDNTSIAKAGTFVQVDVRATATRPSRSAMIQ